MRSIRRTEVALVVLCFVLAACGKADKAGSPVAVNYGLDQSIGESSPSSSPRSSGKATPKSAVTKSAKPGPSQTGPSPVALPWTPSPDVPVEATVSPVCFTRGGIVTLTVHTKPKAGVGYIAVYSDNGNGAPKPTGNGYGGNASGFTNGSGEYVSTFTVSRDAPPGPGRVDVIVGWEDEWGYAGPTFTVAGPDGRC